MSVPAIGVDVGGTKATVIRLGADGSAQTRASVETPADDIAALVRTVRDAVRSIWTSNVGAIGIGAAGLVEAGTGVVRYSPNIAWRDVDLGALFQGLGVPVFVDNDCTTAAFGELRAGAGLGVNDFLYVGVGTGIGGGIVADGRVVRGAHGFAAEIGHIIVQPGGITCGCGQQGCWETVASGSAIDRLGAARLGAGTDARAVVAAARTGDAIGIDILDTVGARLGSGIAGLVNVLDPALVVVGGGAAAGAGELLLGPARAAAAEAIEGVAHRPAVPIVPAALGPDGAAVGAARWAQEAAG